MQDPSPKRGPEAHPNWLPCQVAPLEAFNDELAEDGLAAIVQPDYAPCGDTHVARHARLTRTHGETAHTDPRVQRPLGDHATEKKTPGAAPRPEKP